MMLILGNTSRVLRHNSMRSDEAQDRNLSEAARPDKLSANVKPTICAAPMLMRRGVDAHDRFDL